jgi:hypothetical protein
MERREYTQYTATDTTNPFKGCMGEEDVHGEESIGVHVSQASLNEHDGKRRVSWDIFDSLCEKYFMRYDIDESHTLNSDEELQQLSLNLTAKLDLGLTPAKLEAIVNIELQDRGSLSDVNSWATSSFKEWYINNIVNHEDSTIVLSAESD